METVFVTIHDGHIRYCSESVEYILGYQPHEIKGRSCWDFFHPDEVPFARAIHGRGINLDKAAVFSYCRIKHKDGTWIGCECVFTVVYDVLIASTAIYQRGPKSQKRALDGAGVRRIFASSPRDPRYHMLSFISNKFYQEPQAHAREPRAALILNRFTRTSTIMFATNGVAAILGLQPHQLVGKSFYYCIAPNCLDEAIECLESAKSNDSIAYLRFWYRDPTQDPPEIRTSRATSTMSEDPDEDGGVSLAPPGQSAGRTSPPRGAPPEDGRSPPKDVELVATKAAAAATPNPRPGDERRRNVGTSPTLPVPGADATVEHRSRSSSDESNETITTNPDPVFDQPTFRRQSTQSSADSTDETPSLELEAVVSCTSDGLVLVLRKAMPLLPHTPARSDSPYYANGLFASPWAPSPVPPPEVDDPSLAPNISFPATNEATEAGFMAAIRDVAVFAWSLTGINGSLADHARGHPVGEALPPGGLPVWDAENGSRENDIFNGFGDNTHRRTTDLYPSRAEENLDSSDDEVLWKRTAQQPPWRRPKRRAHQDAFEADSDDGQVKDADGRIAHSRRRRLGGEA